MQVKKAFYQVWTFHDINIESVFRSHSINEVHFYDILEMATKDQSDNKTPFK